ncbi:MAG: NAD-dependent epimerase/dehydratase family protein [Gemmatimonadetes bacterium]|nr:NAD-dependent epimerase/dehydratase family protein [Gemmatimonadota bacterium]
MSTRRSFLGMSAGVGGAAGFAMLRPNTMHAWLNVPQTDAPLRILILGGTRFLGVAQVQYALARGHTVTLFNRGRTNTHLFPEVEKLRGDRNDDLTALQGREWDVVIDNSASVPRWVEQSAGLLRNSARQYIYVSSLSVIADNSIIGSDETTAVKQLDDPTVEQVTGGTYGGMKALCEQRAQEAFGDRAMVVRPGLIVGPMDNTDRFTYWPIRIDRGGEVMAPGNPTHHVQIIDVRDLASWMVRMGEDNTSGVYNATGPASPMSMAEMLYGIRAATSANVSFTWVNADFLEQHEVRPWSHMPTWRPPREGMQGFSRVNCSKAIAAGLTFRPLAETASDTITWFKTLPAERQSEMGAGLSAEREVEVLAAWQARAG